MKPETQQTQRSNFIQQGETMKVVLTGVLCGPEGNAWRGNVLDLPKEKADEMIAGKFARPYDPQKDAKAKQGLQKAER